MDLRSDSLNDLHFCILCQTTILGLDNYVNHRKGGCVTTETFGSKPVAEEQRSSTASETEEQREDSLKADDFFSCLELQSSSKKIEGVKTTSRPLTRSKANAALQANNNNSNSGLPRETGGKTASSSSSLPKELNGSRNPTVGSSRNVISPYQPEDTKKEGAVFGSEQAPHLQSPFMSPSNFMKKECVTETIADQVDQAFDHAFTCDENYDTFEDFTSLVYESPRRMERPWKSDALSTWECWRDERYHPLPPPSFTGGKWNPSLLTPLHSDQAPRGDGHSEEEDDAPPPEHTSGKWLPQQSKEGDYWCNPCNRRLTSRAMYDRHMVSDVHFKWSLEQDLEEPPTPTTVTEKGKTKGDQSPRVLKQRRLLIEKESAAADENEASGNRNNEKKKVGRKKKRKATRKFTKAGKAKKTEDVKQTNAKTKKNRRKLKDGDMECVCGSIVSSHMMGRHLVSSLQDRKARKAHRTSEELILKNMESIVKLALFQCLMCRFYCNSSEDFKLHWQSQQHILNDSKVKGYYWCSVCSFMCNFSNDMQAHLEGSEHHVLLAGSSSDQSVVIRKRELAKCGSCKAEFCSNIALRQHWKCSNGVCLPDGNSDTFQGHFSCCHCEFFGSSKVSLQRHIVQTHRKQILEDRERKFYYCSACCISFNSPQEVLTHRRTQEHKYTSLRKRSEQGLLSKEITKTCPHCNEKFGDVLLLKEHIREKHADLMHNCPQCGMRFALHQEVTMHVRNKACLLGSNKNKGDLKCRHCPYQTENIAELLFHEALHSPPDLVTSSESASTSTSNSSLPESLLVPKYRCPVCSKMFKKHVLRCHLYVHTGERPFVCKICDRQFGHRSSLAAHINKTHRTKPDVETQEEEVCDQCNFRTKSKTSMYKHRARHHQRSKSFLCAVCGKSFYVKSTLQQHMLLHTGKALQCPVQDCIFRCRSQAELKYHSMVHSDDRPYRCESCPYRAKTKPQLVRHNKIHLDLKAYQCPYCDFSARLSAHLRRHLRLHTGAKPYKCPHCSYECNILENLRKHVLCTNKHPGKKMYECQFCVGDQEPYSTNLSKELQTHLVQAHPDRFQTVSVAASYVTGIYVAQEDPKYIANPIRPSASQKRKPSNETTPARKRRRQTETVVELTDDSSSCSNNNSVNFKIETGSLEPDPVSTTCSQELMSASAPNPPSDEVVYIRIPTAGELPNMDDGELTLFPTVGIGLPQDVGVIGDLDIEDGEVSNELIREDEENSQHIIPLRENELQGQESVDGSAENREDNQQRYIIYYK